MNHLTLFDSLNLKKLYFSFSLKIKFFSLHYFSLFFKDPQFYLGITFLFCYKFKHIVQMIHLLFYWCNCNLSPALEWMERYCKIYLAVKDGQIYLGFLEFLFCFRFCPKVTDLIGHYYCQLSYSLVL